MAFPPLPQPAEFDWKKFLVTALVNVLGKFVENIPPFLEKHSGTVATFFAGHLAKTSPDTAMWALLGLVITGIFCFMLHKLLTPRQSNFTEQQITAMEQRLTEVIKSEFLKLRAQSATSEQQLFTTSDQICHEKLANSVRTLSELAPHFFYYENISTITRKFWRKTSVQSSRKTAIGFKITLHFGQGYQGALREQLTREDLQRRRYQERVGKMQYDCESPNQQELVSSRKLFPPIRCSPPSVDLICLQQTASCLISDNVWSLIASSVKIYKIVHSDYPPYCQYLHRQSSPV
ncbi:hypothetical protein KEM48_001602 [Puccinia striiformis f. sp. tritici PST-130]|nr:hypothetical protein KEM48_001602 [Puccinia striiformis f. sp. tritici PST-130]